MSSLGTAKQRESIRSPSACSLIERWVDEVEILLIHTVLGKAQAFAEALEVDDFAGAQELDGIVDVRVVGQAQDVVVGDAGLLLGGHILGEVGENVALDADACGIPGCAGGGSGVDAGRVVHEVGLVSGLFDLLRRHVARELVDDCADHLKVSQLLGTDIGQQPLELRTGHGIALAEVAQRRPQLPIRAPVWQRNAKTEFIAFYRL